MIKLNSQYPSKVSFVKKSTSQNGTPITRFSIGDKVKDAENTYINYNVTVFENLNIVDGDHVTITSIDNLETRLYNGKLYYSFIGKVKHDQPGGEPIPDDAPLPFNI